MHFLDEVLPNIVRNVGAVDFWRKVALGFRNGSINSWAWRMHDGPRALL
jgi:hypothetical protein